MRIYALAYGPGPPSGFLCSNKGSPISYDPSTARLPSPRRNGRQSFSERLIYGVFLIVCDLR
jgi:hypothetical protein